MFAHKSQYRILTLLLMLVAGIGVLAQNSLVLINPGTQIEGRKFALTFRATGGQASGLQAPSLKGCKLIYGPSVSTMESVQYINRPDVARVVRRLFIHLSGRKSR